MVIVYIDSINCYTEYPSLYGYSYYNVDDHTIFFFVTSWTLSFLQDFSSDAEENLVELYDI